MTKMTNHNYLIHYASPYYDPVKAHEYYEAHKKLKGRYSTKKWSENQKKTWNYVKNQISDEKKNKTEEERESHKKDLETMRSQAEQKRKQITDRIKAKIARIDRLSKERKEAFDNEIIGVRTKDHDKRASAFNKNRKEYVDENAKSSKKSERESGKAEKDRLKSELKSSIERAREKYKSSLEDIKTNYENIKQQEYENIKKQVK